ncbi:UNVERIFIED_CONTAM: hypothetical protein Slati_3743000 [Sesamum latifolium]|uniref:Uncharacterized protein n=1 Tax=Sesamum latifolium TaxID=2727402 RepID=A0AAW2U3W3_9LAMI
MEIDNKASTGGPMIHFGPADAHGVYQQMELGDVQLEPVDTSLYGFAGEVVHPLGQISLPLALGSEPARRTGMVHFLVVDMPSLYNLIQGRPALNTFQTVVSTYHIKFKFPVGDGIGEVRGDQYTAQKCYIEVIKISSNKMEVDIPNKESNKNFSKQEDQRGTVLARVQSVEKLLSSQLVLGEPDKITKIGSQLSPILVGQLTAFLQQNADVFAWTTSDLIGIDPA